MVKRNKIRWCWLLLLFSHFAFPAIPAGPEHFECGRYLVTGRLVTSSHGFDLIKIYPDTTREYEILLDGVPIEDIFAYAGKIIQVEINVSQPAEGVKLEAFFSKVVDVANAQQWKWNAVKKIGPLDGFSCPH